VTDAVDEPFDRTTRDADPPTQAHHRQGKSLATDCSVARRPIHTKKHGCFFDAQEGLGDRWNFRLGASHRRLLSKMGFIIRTNVTLNVTPNITRRVTPGIRNPT
jgi:hypothetical protein